MRVALAVVLLLIAILAEPVPAATTFSIPEAGLGEPLVFIAYDDIRFHASQRIGQLSGGAACIGGQDRHGESRRVVHQWRCAASWHRRGLRGLPAETQVWRERQLPVYPALGNHELAACFEPSCLERWWNAFPELKGRRWYSVAVGSKLLSGSEQRAWLESQVDSLDPKVRVVLIVMHLVVSAGHIHDYERLKQDGVTYLVSGGGGATPYQIDRTKADLYQSADFPNYHYVRFEMRGNSLSAEMIRLEDYSAAKPVRWRTEDRFEISLRP